MADRNPYKSVSKTPRGESKPWLMLRGTGSKVVVVLAGVVAFLASAVAVMDYLEKKQERRAAEAPESLLRTTYVYCTGSYNHTEKWVGDLTGPLSKEFTMRPGIVRTISLLREGNGNGPSELELITEGGLERIVPTDPDEFTKVRLRFPEKGEWEVWRAYKFQQLLEHFQRNPPDLKFFSSLGVLPHSTRVLLKYNPQFNELVEEVFIRRQIHDATLEVGVLFRSLRTVSVELENISPDEFRELRVLGRYIGPERSLEIWSARDPKWKPGEPQALEFPMRALLPGERIVLPLEIRYTPGVFASAHIYEEESEGSRSYLSHTYETKELTTHRTLDGAAAWYRGSETPLPADPSAFYLEEQDPFFTLKQGSRYEELRVGPSFVIEAVEVLLPSGKQVVAVPRLTLIGSEANRILRDDNCECGSCPLIMARNARGFWRVLGEVLASSGAREKAGEFAFDLPPSAKALRISEPRGEESWLWDLALEVESKSGQRVRIPVGQDSSGPVRVSADSPLTIEISPLLPPSLDSGIASLKVTGRGYYETSGSTICPVPATVPHELFD